MMLAEVVWLALTSGIALSVFGFGLSATFADKTFLFRRPGLLLRSVLSMNVVMFALAIIVVLVLDLHRALEIGLVALSLSPVPPLMPRKLLKAGSTMSAAVGLVTAMSVLTIVIVPLGVALAGTLVGEDLRMPIVKVASTVLVAVIVPLSFGIAFRRFAPGLAERVVNPLWFLATALLVLAIIPLLIVVWPRLLSMFGSGIFPALALFSVTGLAVGHVLGGPDDVHRTVLALATSTRHPGMALAIAGFNYPDEQGVMAVVLSHMVVAGLVALPYLAWRRRLQARPSNIRGTETGRRFRRDRTPGEEA